MPLAPGDHVHVSSLGKGIVREVRNGERYLVEVKGRSIVTTGDQLTRQDAPRKALKTTRVPPHDDQRSTADPPSLDLHGFIVADAVEAISAFVNSALLGGHHQARIIHGRSGGRIKSAVHAQLGGMRSVRSFRLDPRNPGVTIVEF
jgi:dsDNA-specific endonuclease/ATPase MutS2